MIDPQAIYVGADGRPLEKPEPLAEDATVQQWIEHMRAMNEWRDQITDRANRAFDIEFRKALRR